MARRGGGFGGFGLDPFGGGGGDLSRYNLGTTVGALDELEAYQIAVGWANGTVTDAEYLASLERAIERTGEGTRDRITAQDKYDDAVYRIERNKLVARVNDADDDPERIASLQALIAHDRARSGQMVADNEQRREIDATIAGLQADIRQTRYSALVERVNRGRASTSDLINLARSLYAEADGGPDARDWQRILGELRDRLADERLATRYQDYQHERITGPQLLADLDARLSELEPGSPAYVQLFRQREDLDRSLRDAEANKQFAQLTADKNAGKVTDNAYIAALRTAVDREKPGTQGRIDAENRLRQAVFSLAEDKLRYDVSKGRAGAVAKLIAFYASYKATMTPGSSEWRQLDLAIDSLKRRGASGGGGGGGGGSIGSGGSGSAPPKLIPEDSALGDLINGTGPFAGVKIPPNVARLMAINPNDKVAADWFDNNRRSMIQSYQNGDDTWTFFDLDGKVYDLPFASSMLSTIDEQNVRHMQTLVASASTPKAQQAAVGKLITALSQHRDRGGQMAMDSYRGVMEELDREKSRALARGDYADYATLVFGQEQLIRRMLMLPDSVPITDANLNLNPVLDDSMVERIAADLDRLEPAVLDPGTGAYHPGGDQVMTAIREGAVIVRDRDGDGMFDAYEVDEDRAFVTQGPNGEALFNLLNPLNDAHYFTNAEGIREPKYKQTHVRVSVLNADGEPETYFQPVASGAVGLNLRAISTATTVSPWLAPGANPLSNLVGTGSVGVGPQAPPAPFGAPGLVETDRGFSTYLTNGQLTEGVKSFSVLERDRDGKLQPATWVSLDGETFMRIGGGAGAPTPQLVLNPGSGATYDPATGRMLVNGEAYNAAKHGAIGQFLHIYGTSWTDANGKLHLPDWVGKGKGSAGVGGPGQFFETRKIENGILDVTPYEDVLHDYDDELTSRRGSLTLGGRAPDPLKRERLGRELNPPRESQYDNERSTVVGPRGMGRITPLVQKSATLGDWLDERDARRLAGTSKRAAAALAISSMGNGAMLGLLQRTALAKARYNPTGLFIGMKPQPPTFANPIPPKPTPRPGPAPDLRPIALPTLTPLAPPRLKSTYVRPPVAPTPPAGGEGGGGTGTLTRR